MIYKSCAFENDKLTNKIRQFINESENEHKLQRPVWEKCNLYYSSKMSPTPFKNLTSIITELRNNNDNPNLVKDPFNTIFYQTNEIKPIIKRLAGQYSSVNKDIIVEPLSPEYTTITDVIKTEIDFIERDISAWDKRSRAIKSMFLNGISYNLIEYNPYINFPKGRISIKNINPKYIYLDPTSTEDDFSDIEYYVYVAYLKPDSAKNYLRLFGKNIDSFPLQSRDEESYRENAYSVLNNFVKLYFVSHKEPVNHNYQFNDDKNFFSQQENQIFHTVFHDTLGIIYHNKSPYSDFLLSIYYGERTEIQTYPKPLSEDLIPLNDLYNIINTLYLENARKNNRDIYKISESLYKEKATLINEALSYGGGIPLKNNEMFERMNNAEFNPDLINVLNHTREHLNNAGYIHEALRGDVPNMQDRMSGKAISLLQVENRRVLTEYDRAIENACTYETKMIYELITKNRTYERHIKYKTNDKNYFTPVNQITSLKKYKEFLNSIQLDSDTFESNNDVKYIYPDSESPEYILQNTIILINPYYPDADISLSIKLDFDISKDKHFVQERNLSLFKMGVIDDEALLESLDYPNWRKIIERKKKIQMEMLQSQQTK